MKTILFVTFIILGLSVSSLAVRRTRPSTFIDSDGYYMSQPRPRPVAIVESDYYPDDLYEEPRYVRPYAPRVRVYTSHRPMVYRDDDDILYERPSTQRSQSHVITKVEVLDQKSPRKPRASSRASATKGTAVSFAHTDGKSSYSTGFATTYPRVPELSDIIVERPRYEHQLFTKITTNQTPFLQISPTSNIRLLSLTKK